MNVFEIEPQNREAEYWKLRNELANTYSVHIGPQAQRNNAHQIARLRAAGDEYHARMGDAQERRMEEDIIQYHQRDHERYLLAILTGRYDHAIEHLIKPTALYSETDTQGANIIRAAKIRKTEMGE